MQQRITLTINNTCYDVLRCRYGLHRETDSKGRPTTGLLGGTMLVQMESSKDAYILEQFLLKSDPPFCGKMEVFDEYGMALRTISWDQAHICAVSEGMIARSPWPMTMTVAISPMRLDIDRIIRLDRRWPQVAGACWREYVPEEVEIADGSTEKEILPAECTVHFRPSGRYKGEYGFDWLRLGDSGKGDLAYATNMGPTEKIELDDGKTIEYFTQDRNEYKRFLGEYEKMTIQWKRDQGSDNYLYLVPVMTLLKDRAAVLTAKIEVGSPASKLRFDYDKNYFMVTSKVDSAEQEGWTTVADAVTIKCVGEFEKDQYITAIASNEGGEETIAGKLKVKANSAAHRRSINLVLVEVKTNISGKGKEGIVSDTIKRNIAKYFDQFYVKANIVTAKIDMKNNPEMTRNNSLRNPYYIFDALNQKMSKEHPAFAEYYKAYFIDEKYVDKGGGNIVGVAKEIGGSKEAVILEEGINDEKSITHELLHCLGLKHPFDQKNNFKFRAGATNNIMDYNKFEYELHYTWQYQWREIKNRLR